MFTYYFKPTASDQRPGVVTIERPLDGTEADLWETGPMFRVNYLVTRGARFASAFLDELRPLGNAPEPEWGAWWQAEDTETSGGIQFFIETGERQTRQQSYEHSIDAANRRARAHRAAVSA